ncbi:hypothetical protein TNCV_4989451 [Trichonephila clavipes]|uniref:Uncharacterized protein n=1 Tax=Trichonephila clavipes TaxID=2585209 RepID=A0A8X6WBU3_TRICX|nr:hypothetical protein TNCV_4989451 [Trichonephila clavipes]
MIENWVASLRSTNLWSRVTAEREMVKRKQKSPEDKTKDKYDELFILCPIGKVPSNSLRTKVITSSASKSLRTKVITSSASNSFRTKVAGSIFHIGDLDRI